MLGQHLAAAMALVDKRRSASVHVLRTTDEKRAKIQTERSEYKPAKIVATESTPASPTSGDAVRCEPAG